jgi:hypothetical protein
MRRNAIRIAVFVLPFAIACTAATVNPPTGTGTGAVGGEPPGSSGQPADPSEPGPTPVTTPDSQVTVALASVRLGDEGCTHDESLDITPQSCAMLTDASPRGTGMCGGPCKFTNVQLAFTSIKSGAPSKVTIMGATLLDAATGNPLAQLSAYSPLVWSGTQYVTWDENVAAGAQVKASYTLSPPPWSQLGGSYSTQYKVRIVVNVDGVGLTVESDALQRDPPVAT